MINISKTVYEKVSEEDGTRILVMRYWPRGVRREAVDEWLKELGSSPGLIRDWKDGKLKWPEFRRRFILEPGSPDRQKLVDILARESVNNSITLLCSCRNADMCHRSILKEMIENRIDDS